MVPRYSEIHSSQLAGRGEEVLRRAEHELEALQHRRHQEPDQAHVVVEREPRHRAVGVGDPRRPATIASMLATTQRSGSITPFGSAVDPLVNCRIGQTVGIVGRRVQLAGARRARPRRRARRAGRAAASRGRRDRGTARGRASTTTTAASALAMRVPGLVDELLDRPEAHRQRQGDDGRRREPDRLDRGDQRARRRPEDRTCTPGPTPRAWSAAAMPRASSWSWRPLDPVGRRRVAGGRAHEGDGPGTLARRFRDATGQRSSRLRLACGPGGYSRVAPQVSQ